MVGTPTVNRALLELWKRSSNQLTTQELEWFSDFTEQAEINARELAEVVENIGCLIGCDEKTGSFQDQDSMMNLLSSLSHQIDAIAGMVFIGSRATDRLNDLEQHHSPAGSNDRAQPTEGLITDAISIDRA